MPIMNLSSVQTNGFGPENEERESTPEREIESLLREEIEPVQEEEDNIVRWSHIRQVVILMVAASCNLLPGITVGWSVVVPYITSDNFNITITDVQWIISSSFLTTVPGNFLSGPMIYQFGSKGTLILSLGIGGTAWILQGYSPFLWIMYVARCVLGFCSGLVTVCIQTLVAELSEPAIRGFTSGMPEMMLSTGIMYVYLLVKFLEWNVATYLCSIPALLTLIGYMFVPESPYWLVKHNRAEDAKKALIRMMGSKRQNEASDTLNDIMISDSLNLQTKFTDQIKLLKQSQNWKPVLLVLTLFILRELGGEIVVFTYTIYLFKTASCPVDPFTSTIIVGMARIISTIIGSHFMDRYGRRPILLTSSTICMISLSITGGLLIPKTLTLVQQWVCVVSIYTFVVSFGCGFGPVLWTLLGELIPTPVRGVGSSLVVATFGITSFVLCNFFIPFSNLIGIGVTLLVFAAITLIFILVAALYLPETKGKTLLELEGTFNSSNNEDNISIT